MTFMTRRELLAAMGLAGLIGCRRAERSQPDRLPIAESTVTLTVDGMV